MTNAPARGASVERGERIRLFCALDLPDDARNELCAWAEASLADRGRLVPAENLHLTLAFLGHRPVGEVPGIVAELRAAAAAAQPAELRPLRYRETRSVGMIVLDDVGGAATESMATTASAPERTSSSQISSACSPVSGWETSSSSTLTPTLFA